MDILATLRRSGGIDALVRELDLSPAVAAAGAEALLPALIGGFARQRDRAGGGDAGLISLVGTIGNLGGGTLAANVLGPDKTDIARGTAVLDWIFGSKDASRLVALHAVESSQLDAALLRRMLPLLAMLVGGYLAARAGGSGAVGSGGIAGLDEMLELDSDINPLDAILVDGVGTAGGAEA